MRKKKRKDSRATLRLTADGICSFVITGNDGLPRERERRGEREREREERERERERERRERRERGRENSKSKTLFYKNRILGSVKNLTISPC